MAPTQSSGTNPEYSKQLLLQMPPSQQPTQQPQPQPPPVMQPNNNVLLTCQPNMEEMVAAMYNPAPMVYMPAAQAAVPAPETYLYPPMDPFSMPMSQGTPELKDSAALASPSSTSSSSCSNYSMLMVPQGPQAGSMAFYSPAASPAAEVRREEL